MNGDGVPSNAPFQVGMHRLTTHACVYVSCPIVPIATLHHGFICEEESQEEGKETTL